ncbi:CheR family methyltransferase [Natronogracilivirga saccharolytica]|uniref:Protein-glutamate O-methyltransferase CheR n=1 Tax=Natronogracilivirga saccharolytica TaxID=2812953 RepID=A0A8J7UUE3_9BACT|nr:protein-glutamate O-methyltransferase CheR [Natronogracilivirga saccharolytica]MBP3191402.1 protein-glutamate O-methyltransferase CheR [Natronogracilivirga saccharolytica]
MNNKMARERPCNSDDVYPGTAVGFLQWALPKLGYRWAGYRKPRRQVIRRIRSLMADTGCTSYADYARFLERNPEEWKRLDANCDITISRFFRDRKLWDQLRDDVLPELMAARRPEPLRIWSAGCCNGEEAYSAAIMLMENAGQDSTGNLPESPGQILATDRNPEVLRRAESAFYSPGSLKEATANEKQKWFEFEAGIDKSDHVRAGAAGCRVRPEVRRLVTFRQLDISKKMPDTIFDIIFCRNLVFTYFTEERQFTALESFAERMQSNGYLITGSHEKLPDCALSARFEMVTSCLYKLSDGK